MKKIIFTLLAVLLTLAIVSCNFTQQENTDDVEYTDVVYSEDGKSITLYLDSTVPVTEAARALNGDLAKMSHDFFEVVFFGGTGQATARTSWELGQSAGIGSVPRVAYGTTVPADPATTPTAVIFVGRKDRTLLAVGTIDSNMDRNPTTGVIAAGTPGTITANTVSVTFAVTAFDAGAGHADLPRTTSSFTGGTADKILVSSGAKVLPVHQIGNDNTADAITWTHGITSAHLNAIRVSNAGTVIPAAELRSPPRYVHGGRTVDLPTPWSTTTEVDFATATTTALTAGNAFPATIVFDITSSAVVANRDGVCALNFQVPVYAVNINPAPDTTSYVQWYIRPGFGTSRYDLDDGTNGPGGSLLLCVGPLQNYIDINVSGL